MRVYLARHGQTTANSHGIILGRSDAPLTESGLAMAEQLGNLLSGYGIRRVLTSPLGRARDTAEIIARRIAVIPVTVDELTELSCGRWEGRLRADVLGKQSILRSSWTACPPDGESCRDAEKRAGRVIAMIREALDTGPVLVVGHAVINRVLLKLWYRLDPSFANGLMQAHDHIYALHGDSLVRWLCADGKSGTGWRHVDKEIDQDIDPSFP